MPENGWKIDRSINLSTLLALAVAAGTIFMAGNAWVINVNASLKEVGKIVVAQGESDKRLQALEKEILINREETLKNRAINQEILKRVD